MHPSWIFASRAEPSWECPEPSRAELAIFTKRAEYELILIHAKLVKLCINLKVLAVRPQ